MPTLGRNDSAWKPDAAKAILHRQYLRASPMRRASRPFWLRYSVAVVVTVATLALKLLLVPVVDVANGRVVVNPPAGRD